MPKDPKFETARQKRRRLAREAHNNYGMALQPENNYATAGDYARDKQTVMPKGMLDFKRIVAEISREAEDEIRAGNTREVPTGVALMPLLIYEKLFKLAIRESVEQIDKVKCPKCKQYHTIICPNKECPKKEHPIPLPNALMEKNQMSALLKLSDKFAPNRAAVTHDINVTVIVANINDLMAQFILKYVPAEERVSVLSAFRTKMLEVSDGEESS